MNINFKVKVKAGPRTPVSVEARGTAVNEKKLRFANGKEVTEAEIANHIEDHTTAWLSRLEEGGE